MRIVKSISNLFRRIGGKKKAAAIIIREIPAAQINPKAAKPAKKAGKSRKTERTSSITEQVEGQSLDTAEEQRSTRKPRQQRQQKEREKRTESSPRTTRKQADNRPFIENYPEDTWAVDTYQAEIIEGKTRFTDLGLPTALLHAVHDIGFSYCTDIQAEILPHSLKGIDVTGKAQTGTGKTAAFLLTNLVRLMSQPKKERRPGSPRVLIMAPTRELVIQIDKDAQALAKYTGARILPIFGGMDYDKQREALEEHVDIVIATPGRMLDYYKQKVIRLKSVEILVLDEADRMLDMGFLPDVRRVIDAVPDKSERQTMLFSATLTPEILRLASMWTNSPIKVEIEPEQITSANIEQLAYVVSYEDKFTLLYNLLKTRNIARAIIFANRKDEVRKLAERLEAADFSCGMLTGDVTQARRIKTLENLRSGKINFLVATDVAGRGIHVDNVEYVFNYTLPEDPDDYVHRIGRTGRAGELGISVAFATEEDSYVLPQIEAHIKEPLKYLTPEEELLQPVPDDVKERIKQLRAERRSIRGSGGRSSSGGRRPQRRERPRRG
ncbi:MAG: DEAD/DEAH box helicase [Deferribacteraceae bacterium]|jgi:ATP-dependent RNA helicase RhlB|nr:DEAD/DEAH box helicase [Deferribacteraceae bacterium]